MLFDKIAWVYFIGKVYFYFCNGNASPGNQHCANCISTLSFPEFGAKFEREVAYSRRYQNFLTTQWRRSRTKLPCQNQPDSFSSFDRTPTCKDTDTGPQPVPALAQHRVQATSLCSASPSAVNVTLPTFAAECRAAAPLLLGVGACYRSISPAHRVLSSKPTACHCSSRSMGQTDGQTLDHFTDPMPLTMQAVSITAEKPDRGHSVCVCVTSLM